MLKVDKVVLLMWRDIKCVLVHIENSFLIYLINILKCEWTLLWLKSCNITFSELHFHSSPWWPRDELSQWMLIITQHLTILNRCSTRILGKPQTPPPQRWGCLFSNHNRGVIYVAVTRHDLDSAGAQRRRAIDPHGRESQPPLKPWQWNCTASIGPPRPRSIIYRGELHPPLSYVW